MTTDEGIPFIFSAVVSRSFFFHQNLLDLPARSNVLQRLASLTRFREKRKERNFDKKIRYTVRKEVAQRYGL